MRSTAAPTPSAESRLLKCKRNNTANALMLRAIGLTCRRERSIGSGGCNWHGERRVHEMGDGKGRQKMTIIVNKTVIINASHTAQTNTTQLRWEPPALADATEAGAAPAANAAAAAAAAAAADSFA